MTTSQPYQLLPLDSITPNGRHRRDLGDLRGLAASIQRVGLLHPIVLSPTGELVSGHRRIEAARLLGWTEIPAVTAASVDDALSLLLAERDENTERKAFTPEEAVNIAGALEPMEREAAAVRMAVRSENFSEVNDASKGRALDKVGASVGMSRPTLEKAKAVVEAARAEPERFAPIVSEMNRTGKVDPAFKKLTAERRKDERTHAATLAEVPSDGRLTLHHCEVAALSAHVAAASVDLILTDPPYGADAVEAYGDLAAFAAHALRPGCVLLVMTGHSNLPRVLPLLAAHGLTYRWTLAYLTPGGQSPQFWSFRINTFWKPIIALTQGEYEGGWHGDVIRSDVNANEKDFHRWQQSESGMARLVEEWSKPDELVCDPFLGGGTTAVVSLALGRRVIGADISAEAIAATRERLAE